MKYEIFNLREEPINGFMPTLTAYIINDDSCFDGVRKRPAMLVCPGGGYGCCSNREAEPIALQYMAAGYCAFVLDYAVNPTAGYPEPQKNAFDAVALIRKNADKWGIDKDKIAVSGFSAGGHLAASVATLWNDGQFKSYNGENKPNAAVLCYPVISSDPKIAHMGSFNNLCGDNDELKKELSLENRVTADTPPCFLWHTFNDGCVPMQNSLRFAKALKDAGISCELHIFPDGPHGLALANSDTAIEQVHIVERVQEWVALSIKWLNDLFEKEKLGN